MSTAATPQSSSCEDVEAHWADILDGSAEERLYEHLADCDRCRDARHDVERAQALIADAGADFRSEPAAAAPLTPGDVPEPAKRPAPRAPRPALPRAWIAGGALALAAAASLLLRPNGDAGSNSAAERRVRVERVSSVQGKGGLSWCAPSGAPCSELRAGETAPAGSRLKTDFATLAVVSFADGTRVSLDRASELALSGKHGARAELLRGSFVAEVGKTAEPVVFALAQGLVRTDRGKLALRVTADRALIEVASGSAELDAHGADPVVLRAGEQGRLGQGSPLVVAAPALGEALAWSERLDPEEREAETPRGLGELRAQKPGEREERKGAVRLASHSVRARIAGMVARTEIEEVFENTTNEVLEGIYRFPLPPDAKIERLALEVDGKLLDGAFVDRDRAAAIWRGAIVNAAPQTRPLLKEEIVWVPGPWRDPALLEWQRGGRFELRIFPIPKQGSRRIVLAYTQVVPAAGEMRRYSYPLAHDPSGASRVGRFEVDVEVRGHDVQQSVRPAGYELEAQPGGDAARFKLVRDGFVPAGDLTLEYTLESRSSELAAFAYRGSASAPAPSSTSLTAGASSTSSDAFVTLALKPRLPRVADGERRAFAIVVDSSRSMFGESYARAKRVALRLVRELDPDDRVSVLACDSECQHAPGGALEPGEEAERTVRRFLDALEPDGASDPARAVATALQVLSSAAPRAGRVVYIGDGTPTMGPIRPAHLEAAVARALRDGRARVTSVAVGSASDLESLGALSRGGGGVVVPYVPGQSVAEASFAALGAAYGHALRDVEISLPEGLYAVAPSRLDAIPAGGEALVGARMLRPEIAGDVILRGKLGDKSFERRYPVRLAATESRGNAFVPRLYAGLRIADLERDGRADAKREALGLSTAFSVASRYTSLLVLESEAMFRAFGLDNTRSAPEWSGEEQAETSVSELELSDAADDDHALGRFGAGPGGGGLGNASAQATASSTEGSVPKPAPAPASRGAAVAAPEKKKEAARADESRDVLLPEPEPFPQRRSRPRLVPMRRVWQRVGDVTNSRLAPKNASFTAIAEAERAAAGDENRREPTRKLVALLAAVGDLERAARVVERWTSRDPLDVDALTARADLAARRGERETAIRLLGSVVDARPGDVAAQRRLERLHRWAGRAELGCRHLIAAAELRQSDAPLLADALRCTGAAGDALAREQLLAAAGDETARRAEALLRGPFTDDSTLRGDLRVEASWSSDDDVDVALIDPDGHRVSWLGAPTRAVISARDVTASGREGLALRGAKPGEYVVEVVRSRPGATVSGELTIAVAGTTRRVPFRLSGSRVSVAVASVRMEARLVPL